ncbi:hypothetical protein BDZ91DRAFT_708849 [Kalaharituber pfeilii]|nr:hypothetical protein BDZ91DRAFT_708849 [Kalaharituber pfeilii]
MTSLSLYSQAQRKFLRELSKFVTVHLARMIAAEDVGGPVVGEDVTVTLPLGSARSAKAPPREREPGQRTISSMLNPSKKRGADTDGDSEEPTTEKQPQLAPTPQETLAAKSLKSLLEDLMNAAMRPGEYVTLPEPGDSAAARFLVRANVAVLHPRDARRLRLVEFGKSIED